SPDGKQVFVSTADALEQWDLLSMKRLRQFPHLAVPKRYWTRIVVAANGKRAAMEVGARVAFYDLAQGKALAREAGHWDSVGALAWSPSGKELLTVGGDGQAQWWDLPAAKTHWVVKAPAAKPVRNQIAIANQPPLTRGPVDILACVFADGELLGGSAAIGVGQGGEDCEPSGVGGYLVRCRGVAGPAPGSLRGQGG